MKTAIVWLRNDLRLHDNEVLYRAATQFDRVLPVFIIDSEKLERRSFGFRKMGARRLLFLLESLTDLQNQLQGLGSHLLVKRGKPEVILSDLCTEIGGNTVVLTQKEVTREEIDEEELVKGALPKGAVLKFYWGATLYHLNDLPMSISELPHIFTEFRKAVEKKAAIRLCFPIPEMPALPENIDTTDEIPTLEALQLETRPIDQRAAIALKGGESAALQRLNHYLWKTEKLAVYKETRNGLLGADYSSKFSAWLAMGCLSPRTIYEEVKKFETSVAKNQSTYWLIFELIWRDYFRFVALKFGDRLFHKGGLHGQVPHCQPDPRKIQAWTQGETGIPFVDANMRELKETGFMSNRGRQNVASYLVKDLQQDWRAGAAYFEQELIDYDVASNWGNWAYVAGVGNDPRSNRYFNVLTQAQRYDAEGTFVKTWIPELKEVDRQNIHTPWTLNEMQKTLFGITLDDYPAPMVLPRSSES